MTYAVRQRGSAVSTDHQWKIHHAMAPDDQTAGRVDIPVGAGILPVTGVGFRPDAVIFISSLQSTYGSYRHGRFTIGCATSPSTSEQWSCAAHIGYLDVRRYVTEWYPGLCLCGAKEDESPILRATLQSFDSDGFTLNVTEQSSSGIIIVAYLALKGDFKAGVIQVQESIGSLPFVPTGVWLSGSKRIGAGTSHGVEHLQGFASKEAIDPAQSQQSWWSNNRTETFVGFQHWQTTSRYSPGYLANWGIGQDLDSPASSFATYQLWGRCRISSWLSDSIMLEWTDLIDTTPYQFGYLAMGIPCETGRWDWDRQTSIDQGVTAALIGPNATTSVWLQPTLLEEVTAVLGTAPIAAGNLAGASFPVGELYRGFSTSLSIGAVDRNLGRWATSGQSGWDGSIQPPVNNDPEPKSDEYSIAFGEGAGSSAGFVQHGRGELNKGMSFPQGGVGGNGSIFDSYDIGFGRLADISPFSIRKRNHLPRLHVGP